MAKDDKIYIEVLGVDRKKHIAEPHLKTTKCGIKILYKYIPKSKDGDRYFSCYECTY